MWPGQVEEVTASEEAAKKSLYPNTPAAKSRQRLLDAEGPFDNHCQQQRCGQDHRSGQLYREPIGCLWMTHCEAPKFATNVSFQDNRNTEMGRPTMLSHGA
jgi:hypothetical protein